MRALYIVILLLSSCLLPGCGGKQAVAPFVHAVDEQSGESFTHANEPVTFIAAQPALSRVGKDYLLVAPVTVSGAGRPDNYLWFAFGSSIDRRVTGAALPDAKNVVLVIDGMPMTFDLVNWSSVAKSQPFDPKVDLYASFAARVTHSQLRRIAAATELTAYVTNHESRSADYGRYEGEYSAWSGL